MPIVRLPAPTGPWTVGTATTALGATTGFLRPLLVQFWYPALPGACGRRAPYLLETKASLRLRLLGAIVGTDAIVDAPVLKQKLPIVLSLPGWGGRRENSSTQAQNLASHGYIVAAIDDDIHSEVAMDFSSDTTLRASIERADRKLLLGAREAARLIDALEVLDRAPTGLLAGRLDLERLGILGFSFGGAIAGATAQLDARVRAIVNMDGWMFGEPLREGLARPFMVVNSCGCSIVKGATSAGAREAAFTRDNDARILAGLRRYGGYWMTIDGTAHYDFIDVALFPSLRHAGRGTIGGRRAHRILSQYLRQFFDRHLRDRPAPLLDGSEPFESAARLRLLPRAAMGVRVSGDAAPGTEPPIR